MQEKKGEIQKLEANLLPCLLISHNHLKEVASDLYTLH
jgi:hypothetical protein